MPCQVVPVKVTEQIIAQHRIESSLGIIDALDVSRGFAGLTF
jgi:hypothetical protein